MKRKASFYDLTTGLFTGAGFECSGSDFAAALKSNTPIGCGSMEGSFDYLSQRVDLERKQVVDYRPPHPSPDHEWNPGTKRWQLKPEVQAAIAADGEARAAIANHEQLSLRAIRELLLDPENAEALVRLQQLERAIADARPAIKR